MAGLRLIASYPKSGNTWMRAFLASLRVGGATPDLNRLGALGSVAQRADADRLLDEATFDLPVREAARIRPYLARRAAADSPEPLVVKVHDANLVAPGASEPAFPPDAVDRVLYIVRDPRDVAVSGAHHYGVEPARMVEWMADPGRMIGLAHDSASPQLPQFLSSWSRHVESWMDTPGLRTRLVRYEDLLAEPSRLAEVARFFGHDDPAATIARAVEAVSHARLAAQEREAGFRERLPRSVSPFFRTGRAGGWRDTLDAGLVQAIVQAHGPTMRRLGYCA